MLPEEPHMAPLRLALAQCDFAVGAVAANAAKMRALIGQARAGGAALVAFPEMALSGYPPDDLLLRPSFVGACAGELDSLATDAHAITSVVGHPQRVAGALYNAASVLHGGRVEVTAYKQALPNYGVFDDKR
jgi:NAD+ synthase (glutamine-hydrolysing)